MTSSIKGRGGGFRGDRNNDENGDQRSGGFNNNRGGEFSGSFFLSYQCMSIARNGDFQDRNNRFRNNQDDGNQRYTSMYSFRSRLDNDE